MGKIKEGYISYIRQQGQRAAERDFEYIANMGSIGQENCIADCDYHKLTKAYEIWHEAHHERFMFFAESVERHIVYPHFHSTVGD